MSSSTKCQRLPRLKKLVLQIEAKGEGGATVLAALIMKAAPLLDKIVLMVSD